VDSALVCAPSAAGAVIYQFEPRTGALAARGAAGNTAGPTSPPQPPAAHSLARQALHEQRMMYAPDIEHDPASGDDGWTSGSLACVPLVVNNEALGILSVVSPRT